jgi:hypothetical protein
LIGSGGKAALARCLVPRKDCAQFLEMLRAHEREIPFDLAERRRFGANCRLVRHVRLGALLQVAAGSPQFFVKAVLFRSKLLGCFAQFHTLFVGYIFAMQRSFLQCSTRGRRRIRPRFSAKRISRYETGRAGGRCDGKVSHFLNLLDLALGTNAEKLKFVRDPGEAVAGRDLCFQFGGEAVIDFHDFGTAGANQMMMMPAIRVPVQFVTGRSVTKIEALHNSHPLEHLDGTINRCEIARGVAHHLVNLPNGRGMILCFQQLQDRPARAGHFPGLLAKLLR